MAVLEDASDPPVLLLQKGDAGTMESGETRSATAL